MSGQVLLTALGAALLLVIGVVGVSHAASAELFMRDGQFPSHPVRVHAPGVKITRQMQAELCLLKLGAATAARAVERQTPGPARYPCTGSHFGPTVYAPDQTWQDPATNLTVSGTVLIFDLRKISIPIFKTGTRVLPVLTWRETSGAAPRRMLASGAVYLSNGLGAIMYTVLIFAVILVGLHAMSKGRYGGLRGLLCTADHRLSVSLTQMGLWTLAVGGTVLGFGLVRLEVPDIPDTLIMLMGLSVTTSAVGYWQADRLSDKRGGKKAERPRLRDLIVMYTPGESDSDLAKAQILFWTVITLALFVTKSALEGQLWAVPPELVALMGISQAGFLTRKEWAIQKVGPPRPPTERKATGEPATG
jgi:hypothetical protein